MTKILNSSYKDGLTADVLIHLMKRYDPENKCGVKGLARPLLYNIVSLIGDEENSI